MHISIFNTLSGEKWLEQLSKDEVRVGRSGAELGEATAPDIILDSRLVSKEHAILRRSNGSWVIEHLGSNDTLVNNNAVNSHEGLPLRTADQVRIGEFLLALVDDDVEQESEEAVFGPDELMAFENSIHSQLLELMDLRHGETSLNLDSEKTRADVQRHLNKLVEDGFASKSMAETQSIARIAMHRRFSRKVLAAGGKQSQTANAFKELENPPFEAMLDGIQERMGQQLGLTFAPKDIEHDSNKLDAGFKEMFDRFALEFTPGLLRYMGMTFLKRNIVDLIFGLGPLQDLMDADSVSEIMVVSRDKIFVEKFGVVEDSRRAFFSDAVLLAVIERIVAPVGRRIDKSSPLVDAHLADGSRVNAVIPPLALKGPCLTIRKFSETPLTVDDLVGFGSLTPQMAKFLRACVEGHKNLVVSGGTGSGKTTLLNCISGFIPSKERIVTIEDTAELQLKQEHVVTLESRPPNMEGKGAITIRDLVKNALRMRPDRIVIGECRGGEALDMLQAMNTGHDGSMTTGHANTPEDMVHRIETMVLTGTPMPISAIREQIAGAVDIIVQLTRFPSGARRVTHISEVTQIDEDTGEVVLEDVFRLPPGSRGEGAAKHTGYIPTFVEELLQKGVITLDTFF